MESTLSVQLNKRLLIKNTIISFAGQITPLVAAVFTIPYIIRGLSIERFGLLSLAWVILGYLSFFDLGLGRAATKFVAEAIGKGKIDEIPQLVWGAVTVQLILGIIGSVTLAVCTPFLILHVFKIPPELVSEAKATFHILSLAIPVILVSGSFSGLLEAAQRFDLLNIIKIPTSVSIFLLPVIGLLLGFRLPGIAIMILTARIFALLGLIIFYFRIFHNSRRLPFGFTVIPKLLSFGGWITISSIVIPVFVYLDRFLIGTILSMNALGYYTAPYEMVMRFLIIPASLMSVIFPAFSSLASLEARHKMGLIFVRSAKYIFGIMVPITIIFLLFADRILLAWLGPDFAVKSTGVLRVLSIAVLLNAVGYIPFTLIQGVGRPDIIVKYHLIELPLYVAVAYILITKFGIDGAASAWCLRMCWSIPILFILCAKITGISIKPFIESKAVAGFIIGAGVMIFTAAALILPVMRQWYSVGILLFCILIVYTLLMWRYAFDHIDRDVIRGLSARRYTGNIKQI